LITIIIGRAAQFVLALVMLRVATTLLSPDEMGRVSLVLTTIAFFALFLINPVGMFINRRLHAWQASGVARHYLIRYVGYLLMVALLAATVLPFAYMSGLIDFGITIGWLILLVCGSLLFNTINQTAIPSLNMLGDSKGFVILSVATLGASFICAVALVLTIQMDANYWLLGLLLGQALFAVVGARILFSKLHENATMHAAPIIGKRQLRTLFNFAWPVAIAAGLGWLQSQGYRYFIEAQLGLAQLGLFVAGYGISAGIIAGFEAILTTYFQPRLYRTANLEQPAEQGQGWRRYATAVIPSVLLTVSLVVILAPELTKLFLGEQFQSAATFVIWGALAEAARVLAGVYSLIAHVLMRTRWLILPTLMGAVLSITLCALLIPLFGAVGAGVGLVLSGMAVVVLLHVILVKQVGGGVPLKPIVTAIVAATALWGLATLLRDMLAAYGWIDVIAVLAVTGLAYLALQYMFLRQHLIEER